MRSGPDNWPCLRRPIDREGPSLAADEVGLALLEEGGHPLALVLGRERESEGVELPAEVALEITKKQAEEVASHLRTCNVHKLGTISRRKITPIGIGMALSPIEPEPNGPSQIQVYLFVPK